MQDAENGGTACPTDLTQQQPCNKQPCPVDCELSPWSSWSPCSASCGGGTQTQKRTIETQPVGSGKACEGPYSQSRKCNLTACPTTKTPVEGNVRVCGQSGGDNCFDFSPCDLVGKCQSVFKDTPLGLANAGSKSSQGQGWPLSYGASCQLTGFPSVPSGVKLNVYSSTNCEGSPIEVVSTGGNCCSGEQNCVNTTETLQNTKCANTTLDDGALFSGNNAQGCSFTVELEDNYTCSSQP